MATSQSTVWAQLAGIVGAAGGVVFIQTDNVTPVIDVNNFFYDQNDRQLFLGFNYTGGGLSRYGSGDNPGLLVEYGIDSYLQQDLQSSSLYAEHSVSTSRGTPVVPIISQTGDLIGRFTGRAYSGATPDFNVHTAIDSYLAGATTANLGGSLVFSTKADGGVLTAALTLDESQNAEVAGDLEVGGALTIGGLFSALAINFPLGAVVPTNGFAVTTANTLRAYISGVAKWTLNATTFDVAAILVANEIQIDTPLLSQYGGTGLSVNGTAGFVLTSQGPGNPLVWQAAPGAGSVPDTRSINTTAPVSGGGNLTVDRTISLAANGITAALQTQMGANTIKGNNTGGASNELDLTVTQVTAMLNALVGDSGAGGTKGLVPAPAAGDAAAGKFLKADGTWAANSVNNDMLLYQDQKATNTVGNTYTALGWRTGILNTEVIDTGGIGSIAANQVTLAAGSYEFVAWINIGYPGAANPNMARCRLRNVTDGSTIVQGPQIMLSAATAIANVLSIAGSFTIAGAKAFELQIYLGPSNDPTTACPAINSGDVEVYASIQFRRFAV